MIPGSGGNRSPAKLRVSQWILSNMPGTKRTKTNDTYADQRNRFATLG